MGTASHHLNPERSQIAALLSMLWRLQPPVLAAVLGYTNFDKAHTNFDKIEFDSECMKAMCIVDSTCERKGCARDANGRLGCGYFRMNIWQFKQCYEPGREIGEESEAAWIRCSQDYECASKCIKQVASRFRLKCYGKSDCETIARVHDGGANGCRTGGTLPYWLAVKSICAEC